MPRVVAKKEKKQGHFARVRLGPFHLSNARRPQRVRLEPAHTYTAFNCFRSKRENAQQEILQSNRNQTRPSGWREASISDVQVASRDARGGSPPRRAKARIAATGRPKRVTAAFSLAAASNARRFAACSERCAAAACAAADLRRPTSEAFGVPGTTAPWPSPRVTRYGELSSIFLA
jgi:hypothetical protein